VTAEAVEPWMAAIERLAMDEAFYREAVGRTREAAHMYRREVLAPRYAAFFERVLALTPA
jgi:hypothetical protein